MPGGLFQPQGPKDLFRLAVVLQMTSRGIPVVTYGEEVGRPGGDWPANRSDMPWGGRDVLPGKGLPRDEGLRDLYRRLIGIRRAHPALSRGAHQGLATDGDLYVFLRRDPSSGDAVVVAVNRGDVPATAGFAPPAEWSGAPADLLGGAPVPCAGGRCEITVGPLAAAVIGLTRPR